MTKIEFKKVINRITNVYGVSSYLLNEENDDPWFECPECGEPILYDDYGKDFKAKKYCFICPICEEEIEY